MFSSRLVVFLFLGVLGCAFAVVQIEHVRPGGNGKIAIPQYPTNSRYGITYSCLAASADRWPGKHWMVGITANNNESIIHHMILYTIPLGSPLLEPGQVFHGLKDGDIVEDCTRINSAPTHPPTIMYSDQPGNGNLDLLAPLNPNSATANGYEFGVPFGQQQIGAAFYMFQYHVHNDDFEAGLETRLAWTVRTTTDVPATEGGMIFAGVSPSVDTLPDDLFMNIPMNADGEYAISATTQPAALSCAATPAAVPCTSCCPIVPPVRLDNAPYEGRMERYNMPSVSIKTGFLHAHGRQLRLRAETVGFDGTRTLVDECNGCGHDTGVGAFHILSNPVTLNAGEGFRVTCVYGNATDHHAHKRSMTMPMPMNQNVVGGYGSKDEMCLFFGFYAAPVGQSLRPGATLTYGGQCDNVQNEGYPNESRALAKYPWIDAAFCRGNCPFDPTC